MVDKGDSIKQEYAQRTANWGSLLGAIDGQNQAKIVRLGEPSEDKYYYPVDKRRTRENVEAMRTAERNLDSFWSAVDDNLKRTAGERLNGTALTKLLSQPRILQRTPEWIEVQATGSDRGKGVQQEAEVIRKPLSELYFDMEYRTERTVDHRSCENQFPKSKPKNRGVPLHAQPNGQDAQPGDVPPGSFPDVQPTFAVDARALKVFRTLFYTPSITGTPGEVAWTDFLHSMVSTGFVPEKLYGSIWQFSPTKLDVERSIQFHEPHPSGKIPYMNARRIGRRLERAYGWFWSMFTLAEK